MTKHPENVSDTGPEVQMCSVVMLKGKGSSIKGAPLRVYIGEGHANIAKRYCETLGSLYGKWNKYYTMQIPCHDEV